MLHLRKAGCLDCNVLSNSVTFVYWQSRELLHTAADHHRALDCLRPVCIVFIRVSQGLRSRRCTRSGRMFSVALQVSDAATASRGRQSQEPSTSRTPRVSICLPGLWSLRSFCREIFQSVLQTSAPSRRYFSRCHSDQRWRSARTAPKKGGIRSLMQRHDYSVCEYHRVVVVHYYDDRETRHSNNCSKCSYKSQADRITTDIHEWPYYADGMPDMVLRATGEADAQIASAMTAEKMMKSISAMEGSCRQVVGAGCL